MDVDFQIIPEQTSHVIVRWPGGYLCSDTNPTGWVRMGLMPKDVEVTVITNKIKKFNLTIIEGQDYRAGSNPGAFWLDTEADVPSEEDQPVSTGIISLNHGVFRDSIGEFLGFGATCFWAAWGFRHDRDRLIENLKYLKKNKIQYIRALGIVGPRFWVDRTIDPKWNDYEDVIKGTTDLAASLGMRVEWTIFGGTDTTPTKDDRVTLVRQFSQMMIGREHKVMYFEVGNESWQNGFSGLEDEAKLHADYLRTHTPNLVAVTSGREGELNKFYTNCSANLYTVHGDRNTSGQGGLWRPSRQAWDVQFTDQIPRGWTEDEPIGPESSVNTDDDPLRLGMHAALTYLCGGASYVLHTGAGVRGGGLEDLDRNRSKNFWEVNNFETICRTIESIRGLLPTDLPNWKRHNTNHNFPDYPFNLDVIGPHVVNEDVLRAFAATKDNRFIVMPIKMEREVTFQADRNMRIEVIEPLSGESEELTIQAGGALKLRADHKAYIIRGEFT